MISETKKNKTISLPSLCIFIANFEQILHIDQAFLF